MLRFYRLVYIPALRAPSAETQVDGLPPALSLAARALWQNLDSDLDTPFAQRWRLRENLNVTNAWC